MVQAPIFHVNGDDPEAVIFVTQLAFDFRTEFGRDVVIDLVCYRRHGHSEADEPAATQPIMYKKIRAHETVTKIYSDKLLSDAMIDGATLQQLHHNYRAAMDHGETVAPNTLLPPTQLMTDWSPYRKTEWRYPVSTQVSLEVIRALAERLGVTPADFVLHPRVAKIMEERAAMAQGEMALDWGFAETMAYATLLRDGFSVRLSGQDCGRGTFFHRHAVLHDQNSGNVHIPLKSLMAIPPYFMVIDSLLSEEAVLGFEYGFSATEPKCLTIWEAQFGDFANGAQVVIDQFISSGHAKWGRLSGLTMFLPHGFDGQGPEHSSARLERYLQLCAEENIQVCVPTVPAQMFHLLRRQMLRPYRKPLIVMTPKSLLRHRDSSSTLEELSNTGFHPVIDDSSVTHPKKIKRLILCSGKVYFDLLQERNNRDLHDTAIVRIEQLYPFPEAEISEIMVRYNSAKKVVWCQEEPANQGAWQFIRFRLLELLTTTQQLYYAGRSASASPAV
ncbi:MAG: sucA, partial [Halothiobacillaceae bacterium]